MILASDVDVGGDVFTMCFYATLHTRANNPESRQWAGGRRRGAAHRNDATRPIILVLQLGNTSSAETKFYEFLLQCAAALVCVCVCCVCVLGVCSCCTWRQTPSSGRQQPHGQVLTCQKRNASATFARRWANWRLWHAAVARHPLPPSHSLFLSLCLSLAVSLMMMIIQHALYGEPYGRTPPAPCLLHQRPALSSLLLAYTRYTERNLWGNW